MASLMLHARVQEDELVAVLLRVEREIFKLHRAAVQAHEVAGLAEH